MNILDALKTGKRIRRASFKGEWLDPHRLHNYFSVPNILADDWEVEEKKVEITRTQLLDALKDWPFPFVKPSFEKLCKELGLE